MECKYCNGTGFIEINPDPIELIECPYCDGEGCTLEERPMGPLTKWLIGLIVLSIVLLICLNEQVWHNFFK